MTVGPTAGVSVARPAALRQPVAAGLRRGRGGVDGRDDPARGEGAVLRAEDDVVVNRQLLVGVKAADQPVEPVAERRALQPRFLREGLELAVGVAVIGAVRDVDVRVVDVAGRARLVLAVGGDRRERHVVAELVVGLNRAAPIGRGVAVRLPRGNRDLAVIRVGRVARERIDRAEAPEHVDDAVRRRGRDGTVVVDGHARRVRGGVGGRVEGFGLAEVDRGTAALAAVRVVADGAHRELVGRLPEQLAAAEITVAVIGMRLAAAGLRDVVVEPLTLHEDAVEPGRRASCWTRCRRSGRGRRASNCSCRS